MNQLNQKVNYQKLLDSVISDLTRRGQVPSLLLHACCAPCSSYCLEYLSRFFKITVFFFNPNITEEKEYRLRTEELKRLIASMPLQNPVAFLEGDYCPERFLEAVRGMEKLPERGERCYVCYRQRLEESIRRAAELKMDYVTTTLSISPLKNAVWLNEIGRELGEKYGISYLFSDFKKKEGYKRSIELSEEYGLYRQNYCGCVFSKAEQQRRERDALLKADGKEADLSRI